MHAAGRVKNMETSNARVRACSEIINTFTSKAVAKALMNFQDKSKAKVKTFVSRPWPRVFVADQVDAKFSDKQQ